MGTAGTHHGRTAGHVFHGSESGGGVQSEGTCHDALGVFPDGGEQILSLHGDAEGLHEALDDAVQLLHHHKAVHLGGEVTDHLRRQGVDHTQFQNGHGVTEHFLHVLIAGAGGDDAEGVVGALLHTVEGASLRVSGQCLGALLHHGMLPLGVSGHHNVFFGLLFVFLIRNLLPLADLHDALGVGDAGGHTDHKQRIKLLGEGKGCLGHSVGFTGIRGLQHRKLGGDGVVAGILLVLGGMHSGIVGGAEHHTGVHARIGHGEHGIGGHVQTYVLHGTDGSLSAKGRAEGHLGGYFFVGRPLGINVTVGGEILGDLRGGGAGITGNNADAALIEAAGQRLVSDQQFFHYGKLLWCVWIFWDVCITSWSPPRPGEHRSRSRAIWVFRSCRWDFLEYPQR